MKREDITKRAINIRRIRLEREKAIFMKLGSKIKAYFLPVFWLLRRSP